jgi:hypothetical protein
MGTHCFWFFTFNPRGCVSGRMSAVLKRRKDIINVFASVKMVTALGKNIEKFGRFLSSKHSTNSICP